MENVDLNAYLLLILCSPTRKIKPLICLYFPCDCSITNWICSIYSLLQ